jgi:hypothetical protein
VPIVGIEAPDLEPGQEWSDVLSVSMTREDWTVALTFLVTTGRDIHDTIDEAKEAAESGNTSAALAGLLLLDTNDKISRCIKGITDVVYPKVSAEAESMAEYAQWKRDRDAAKS